MMTMTVTMAMSNDEEEVNASLEEKKQQCLVLLNAYFARHPPNVKDAGINGKDAAINFVESIGDDGIVIWMQALCAYGDMSIESGRESLIPEGFDSNNVQV